MYEKLLVPLDGSEFSECIFPYMKAFIEQYQICHVVFVRVVQPVTIWFNGEYFMSPGLPREMESAQKSEAKDYLDQVIKQFRNDGTKIHSEILFGRAAETLSDYTKKNDIDLIIIATHGRSGIARWIMGSVADKILRFSNIPVFMVRAPGTNAEIQGRNHSQKCKTSSLGENEILPIRPSLSG